ncbi:MAG: VWA domain-containing protein [Planctomycetaceae bacterium]|nr:VWA domain-containing protein [Planctomycetaceae bacterium]
MAADFRCEHCGQMVRLEGEIGKSARCPHCQKMTVVPAGLAALPRPHVPPNAERGVVATSSQTPPPAPEDQEPLEEEGSHRDEAMMIVMARSMPWVVSLFLHAALALIMFFLVVMVINPPIDPKKVLVPSATLSENPGGSFSTREQTAKAMSNRPKAASPNYSKKESALITDASRTNKQIAVYAQGGSAGSGSPVAGLAGGAGAPGAGLFGSGGNAHHIVYVIDRSGSMSDSFDLVKRECAASMGRLQSSQDFHIILFAEGAPLEPPSKKLVSATEASKLEAVKFLKEVQAQAQTDPIPALKRAFAVLAAANPKLEGKLLFLLTDGVFPDNEKALATIRALNIRRDVHVNTFLYGNKPPVAVEVLQTIAKENGGKYKFISGQE